MPHKGGRLNLLQKKPTYAIEQRKYRDWFSLECWALNGKNQHVIKKLKVKVIDVKYSESEQLADKQEYNFLR